MHKYKLIAVKLPDVIGIELNKIDWDKVPKHELTLLKLVGLPFLTKRGYLKDETQKEKNS